MITYDAAQLLVHLIGDYLLQSGWMANNKTKASLPALAHALIYGLAFVVLLGVGPAAFAVIAGTHYVIDRYRLARYVCWSRNWLAPVRNTPWQECVATGNNPDTPIWMAVWLMIIVDNVMHLIINALAIAYL